MYFSIQDQSRDIIISGKLVLFSPHTTCSEITKTLCFLVYMHEVTVHKSKFQVWKDKHLHTHSATGSNGEPPGSEYDYMEFSLGKVRNDYTFCISHKKP